MCALIAAADGSGHTSNGPQRGAMDDGRGSAVDPPWIRRGGRERRMTPERRKHDAVVSIDVPETSHTNSITSFWPARSTPVPTLPPFPRLVRPSPRTAPT